MLDWQDLMVGRIRRMSHVRRHTSIPVMRPECVAEHSWYVAMYSYMVGQDMVRRGFAVDFAKLLTGAVVHDIDEYATGDILRTVKHADKNVHNALTRIADEAVQQLDSTGVSVYPAWCNSKNASIEGQIVSLVDVLCVGAYLLEERGFGNRHILHNMKQVWGFMQRIARGEYPKVTNAALVEFHARPAFSMLTREMNHYEPDWPDFHGPSVFDPLYERTVSNSTDPDYDGSTPPGQTEEKGNT